MEDFLSVDLLKSFFTENVNVNMGMAIMFCLLLVLGTRAIRAFLRMLDMIMIPFREFCIHLNKWTNGWAGQFFWVGNCGLWLLSGMFVSGFGFAEHKLHNIGYVPTSVAYGIGWAGIGMTVVAGLAIIRIWMRLEDPKKKVKNEQALH